MASNNPESNDKAGNTENIPRGLLGKGGTPVSKSTRLPSMRAARDLTLGGAQRKSFKPNIPARPRDKTAALGSVEDKLVPKAKQIKKEKIDRPNVNKARSKTQSMVIHSHSIFESGPSERTIKRESIYSGNDGGSRSASMSSKTSASTKLKQTRKETQAMLDELLRDDFIDDDADCLIDATSHPVALPLLNPTKYEEEIKKEVKLTDVDVTDPLISSHILDNTEESLKLVLIQLPDCMPGLKGSDDNIPQKFPQQIKQEPSASNVEQSSVEDGELSNQLLSHCKLTDLSEGKIGKIQVLKSGKTRLVLGDVIFDISRGTPCGFLQELLYVDVDAQNSQMACLGPVKEKLVVVPNIDNLLGT